MIRSTTALSFLLLVSLTFDNASHAYADVVFSIDMDSTSAIQSDVAAPSGSSIAADLIMEISDGMEVSGYSISLKFEPTELNLVSVDEDAPSPLFTGFLGEADTSTSGEVQKINASGFAGTVADGTYKIATLNFTSLTDSQSLLELFFVTGVDGVNGASGAIALDTISFNNGSINAVPEPSAFLMLGLLGCAISGREWMIRRRKSVAQQSSGHRRNSHS